jgi:glucan phosphoethanolaminetransferase (alkaline phosphatase superfamily)
LVVFSLLFAFLPIVIIIFVIAYATKNKGKGDEAVIRHLYTYLVLFATLMMVIGGGISIFMAAADIISPPSYYQSYGDYKQIHEEGKVPSEKTLSEKELRANFEQAVKDEKNRLREGAKNQLIKSLGFIIIPLPIFLYFNSMRKRQSDI